MVFTCDKCNKTDSGKKVGEQFRSGEFYIPKGWSVSLIKVGNGRMGQVFCPDCSNTK